MFCTILWYYVELYWMDISVVLGVKVCFFLLMLRDALHA